MYSQNNAGKRSYFGHGVKVMPNLIKMNLEETQKKIFRFYGAQIK